MQFTTEGHGKAIGKSAADIDPKLPGRGKGWLNNNFPISGWGSGFRVQYARETSILSPNSYLNLQHVYRRLCQFPFLNPEPCHLPNLFLGRPLPPLGAGSPGGLVRLFP